ncbi:heterokaryon incompatibility protein domain-containing protein [Trichoderma aethiopicum]
MRLVNSSTLKLEEFPEDSTPPYAILSHTWGSDSEEVTFRQVENGDVDGQNLGAIKLQGCCQQAQEDGLGYIWIDTCCIDKTNLVELSEAINSMYRWYSRAAVCYAYLSDVPDDDEPPRHGSKFRSSRWFQRGWTLQELLAPKHLRFYNSGWRSIGTKGTMSSVLRNITRVPQQFLLGITSLHGASVAQRMSWAAQRHTKRAEDIAYCLLGIFEVTMPMIYGEGGKQAFFRLQEQIMKTTRDDSILAWGLSDEISNPVTDGKGQVKGGEVLAAGPSSFATSAQIVAREQSASPLHSLDIVGGSVRVYLPLLTTSGGETYGLLSCGPGSDREKVVGIPLVRPNPGASSEYIRPMGCPSVLQPMNTAASPPELIHIQKTGQRGSSATTDQQYWIFEADLFAQLNLALVDVEPPSCWDEQMNLISAVRSNEEAANRIFLRFRHSEEGSRDFVMVLEVTPPATNHDSPFHVVTCSRDTPLLELVENHRHILHNASGRTSASNGTLHLRITLEPVEEGLISINPHSMHRPPDVKIDVSEGLEELTLDAEFTQLLSDRREEKEKEEHLHAKLKLHEDRLHLAKKEREAVEDQIQQLEERRRRLIHVMEQEHEAQMFRASNGPANLQPFDGTEAGDTLIEEVETHGDTEVFRLFDDRAAEALMMDNRGDVKLARKILGTREIEIGHKDSKSDQTAHSYASANMEDAQGIPSPPAPTRRPPLSRQDSLLLDTDKVDVNSIGNNGWSPLRWVSERTYGNIVRLLIDGGASIGCQLAIQCQTDIVSTMAIPRDSASSAGLVRIAE